MAPDRPPSHDLLADHPSGNKVPTALSMMADSMTSMVQRAKQDLEKVDQRARADLEKIDQRARADLEKIDQRARADHERLKKN